MKEKIIIRGGDQLKGEIVTNGSKNATLSILSACLLTKEKCTLRNVPKIEDAYRMIEVMESIGVKTKWIRKSLEIVPPKKFNIHKLDREAVSRFRASILLLGSLGANIKSFKIPLAGGDKIGERTIRPHILALKHNGIDIKVTSHNYQVSRKENLKGGGRYVMREAGDTPTENAIMGAVLAKGKTIIRNASSNYMTQDLCWALVSMGANIKGIGTDTLEIEGVRTLHGLKNYPIIEDPIEAFAFIAMAVATSSKIIIKKVPFEFCELELYLLELMGQKFKIIKEYKSANKKYILRDIEVIPSNLVAPKDKIHSAVPHGPGVNADNLPFFAPVLLRAKGESLICDWAYEGRQHHIEQLQMMGADVRILDAHRSYIRDSHQKLRARKVYAHDLRAGMVMVIAGLMTKGKTVVKNAYQIKRGYENIIQRLTQLGGRVELVIKK